MKVRTNSGAAPDISGKPVEDVNRRDFLRLSTVGLVGLIMPACSPDREPQKESKFHEQRPAELLAAQQKAEQDRALLKALHQDRIAVVDELLRSDTVSVSIRRLLQDSKLPLRLEQVAVVFSDSRRDRKTIDLLEVDKRFGGETRQLVAAFMQYGLQRALVGLAKEFETAVRKERPNLPFNLKAAGITVDPNISIDGDWGSKSSHLREGVQELRLRLTHFYYQRWSNRPRQTLPLETQVGPDTMALVRWHSPVMAACMIATADNPGAAEEYRVLRRSGKDDAGFGHPIKRNISFEERMTPPGGTTPEFVRLDAKQSERTRR